MLIECRDLTKSYLSDHRPVKAVDRANLRVRMGEFIIIHGHSGSGKTTLLSLIGGLTRPDSGEVRIDSKNSWHLRDGELATLRNRAVGFIFQFASLIPTLTILENVLLPLSFGKHPAGNRQLAYDLMERVGLSGRQNDFPAQLSGGQQRRVAIARAFINRPQIILADEPTGDLDVDTEREILQLFRKYNEAGTTFLVVTHNPDLARSQRTARTLTMRQGILAENESPDSNGFPAGAAHEAARLDERRLGPE